MRLVWIQRNKNWKEDRDWCLGLLDEENQDIEIRSETGSQVMGRCDTVGHLHRLWKTQRHVMEEKEAGYQAGHRPSLS